MKFSGEIACVEKCGARVGREQVWTLLDPANPGGGSITISAENVSGNLDPANWTIGMHPLIGDDCFAIPEPGTGLTLLLGLAGLAFCRRC